jgi:hypothetical protein
MVKNKKKDSTRIPSKSSKNERTTSRGLISGSNLPETPLDPLESPKLPKGKIDKSHYGYWKSLYLAFFSYKLYIDVIKRWRGLGIKYFLLLVFIASIPFSTRLSLEFGEIFDQKLLDPIRNLPLLFIHKGNLFFDKPMPYLIRNDKQEVVTIIDSTGTVTEKTEKYPDLTVLVTKNTITYWPPSISLFFSKEPTPSLAAPTSLTFEPDMNDIFNGAEWVKTSGLKRVQYVGQVMVFPVIFLLFFFIFIGFILTFALMAQLLAKLFFSYDLTYVQACRLLIVASTAPVFLFMICFTSNLVFPGFGILMLVVLAIYFCYGVIAAKVDSKKLIKF